ncbi:unnamed protein product [Vicia faba]|uniref:Uncharacterized protein n=1 Tax=Vicia faba TaxID=3906 RepID=A0AAV0YHD5_VICFA|nr:unnamed protein product [Vicia faba]
MPGRPKKKRNLEQGEIDGTDRKLRRTGFIVKCSLCNKIGHNKKTCKVNATQGTASQATAAQGNANQANATQGTASQITASQVAATQASVAQGYMNATQSSQGKSVPGQGTKEKASETGKLLKLGVRRPLCTPWTNNKTLSIQECNWSYQPRRSTRTKRSTSKRTI